MPKNISPGAGEAIERRANALDEKIGSVLSDKVVHARLDELGPEFLGELHASRNMLHELIGCTSYEVGTVQAYKGVQGIEADSWISQLRGLQESCKAYLDATSNDEVAASYDADSSDLVYLVDSISSDAELLIRLVSRFLADTSSHTASTGQCNVN